MSIGAAYMYSYARSVERIYTGVSRHRKYIRMYPDANISLYEKGNKNVKNVGRFL